MINEEGAKSFESITVTSSAVVTFDVNKRAGISRVTISCETASVRYRYDAGDAGVDDGHIMDAGEKQTLEGSSNITNFRAKATGSDGVLKVTYESL